MKKLVVALLALLLVLTACNSSKPAEEKTTESTTQETDAGKEAPKSETPAATGLKAGAYALTDPFKIKDDGSVQVNTTIVTVLLDGDNKIVDARIDVAQNSAVLKDGAVQLPTETPSKQEKGDAYGMKEASSLKKEWFEQANALVEIFKGKTIDEVKALEVSDEKKFVSEDLLATVTIKVTSYIEALAKAAELARPIEGEFAKLGAANITHFSDKAPAEDKPGTVTANTYFGWIALDANDKVLAAFIDTAQNKVKYTKEAWDAESKPLESKQVLGEAYGMKKGSSIGKEWNEQADGLATYLVGKSVADILKVEVEDGKAKDADLLATTTISIGDYLELLNKAATQAK